MGVPWNPHWLIPGSLSINRYWQNPVQKGSTSWWFQPIWKILLKLDHSPPSSIYNSLYTVNYQGYDPMWRDKLVFLDVDWWDPLPPVQRLPFCHVKHVRKGCDKSYIYMVCVWILRCRKRTRTRKKATKTTKRYGESPSPRRFFADKVFEVTINKAMSYKISYEQNKNTKPPYLP